LNSLARIIAAEAAALHARWLAERPQDYGRQTLGRLLPGLAIPAPRDIEALSWRQKLIADMAEVVFAKADALHLPTLTMPVPTIAESDIAANPGFAEYLTTFAKCARPFNYLGLPAISLPCGFTANGLPAAFQLVGRPFDEPLLFRLARAHERETGWTARAPAL
jgi:aspartyl-tRNA(Asn)/glutamyl-tRNA(Gln) amidotransferase subunit A